MFGIQTDWITLPMSKLVAPFCIQILMTEIYSMSVERSSDAENLHNLDDQDVRNFDEVG